MDGFMKGPLSWSERSAWIMHHPNTVTINTVTSPLSFSHLSLSLCVYVSLRRTLPRVLNFLFAHLYWIKKMENGQKVGGWDKPPSHPPPQKNDFQTRREVQKRKKMCLGLTKCGVQTFLGQQFHGLKALGVKFCGRFRNRTEWVRCSLQYLNL